MLPQAAEAQDIECFGGASGAQLPARAPDTTRISVHRDFAHRVGVKPATNPYFR